MKIAFLGTKGIPNNYGGFEQFVEYLSAGLASRGHDVTVYAPHYHPYPGDSLGKVKICRFFCPEKRIGAGAHFLYDFLCLRDAIKKGFEIIYEAGYQSSALAILILRKRGGNYRIVTNMDGMEWKRSKWSKIVKKLTKLFERIAVSHSDHIIADNIGIQDYFKKTYGKVATYLPYGAEPIEHFNNSTIEEYGLKANNYYLIIARLEPENNLEMMIRGYLKQEITIPLIIIGGLTTKYSRFLIEEFKFFDHIRFFGSIYNKKKLDDLRHFSKAYLHGHSVGGTNPSLLEAMACSCCIVAHDNEYNRAALKENAFFFNSENELSKALTIENKNLLLMNEFRRRNWDEIKTNYDWNHVIKLHETFFTSILAS